jgi:acyl-CoA synthetase (AMP-forming)/AMP-acid ligase II
MNASPSVTPLSFLARAAARHGTQLALRVGQQNLTFLELLHRCQAMAAHLRGLGVGPNTRVALYLDDYVQFFSVMFAVWIAGGVVVPMNMSLPQELRRQIENLARMRLGVHAGPWQGGEVEFPLAPVESLSAGLASEAGLPLQANELATDLAMIMFTSGTTGIPKGVPCTNAMLGANAQMMSQVLGLTPEDRLFINTPPYYTSAICHLLTCFSQGAGLVAQGGFFFGSAILEEMADSQCTGMGGAPAHLVKIVETASADQRPPRLRFFMSSGDHLPPALIEKAQLMFPGVEIYTVYGLSEVAGRLCVLEPRFLPAKIGSVGQPLPGMSVTVRREDLSEARPGEVGQIFVQGPLLMAGYLDRGNGPAGGVGSLGFASGDFGYKDADGFLYLLGREDDIFKCGGEKVSTLLIQQVLAQWGGLEDFAAMAVHDELLGKVPVLYYVPRPGEPLDQRALIDYLRRRLPPTHIPKRYVAVSNIPRTGSGKVSRRELLPG